MQRRSLSDSQRFRHLLQQTLQWYEREDADTWLQQKSLIQQHNQTECNPTRDSGIRRPTAGGVTQEQFTKLAANELIVVLGYPIIGKSVILLVNKTTFNFS